MRTRILCAAVALACLGGCATLEPAYHRPGAPVASRFPEGAAYKDAGNPNGLPAADIGWRDFLVDPRLARLVEVALANNRDLRIAALNVQEAQAQYRAQHATLFPVVGAAASSSTVRNPLQQPAVTHTATAGLTASWEIDFFGRLRSLSNASLQQYFATEQAQRAAQILLVSQVADQYLTMLALDDQLEVTRQTLVTAQASYTVVKLQFDTGAVPELNLQQALSVVEIANANLAAQTRARAQAENTLVLLLGGPMPQDLPPVVPLGQQRVLADVPEGLPSDLLLRRPDIVQAEALLRSENANIGAARAAFYPSVSLTGSAGVVSAALGALFSGGSLAWAFLPSITVPIFQGGQLQANLDLARLQKDVGVAQYEKAIQTAFSEVANGLAGRGTYDDQVAAQERYMVTQQRSLDLAQFRYRNGVAPYLDVLTAQTNLYGAQLSLVSARMQRLTNLVDLYRALGGGWIEHTGDKPAAVAATAGPDVIARAPATLQRPPPESTSSETR